MAYNPYLYMPSYNGNNQYGYQNQPIMPYQQTASQPVNGLISVTGIEGARAYQLPPNSCMPLFDQTNDILYVKTTDAAGYPTVKTFRFEPYEHQIDVKPLPDYISRSEFDALSDKVDELMQVRTRTRRASNNGE